MSNAAKYPGWRHMTGAQRRNARKDRIFDEARARGDWPGQNSWRTPLEALRHHVTGAIERGEATPIVEQADKGTAT